MLVNSRLPRRRIRDESNNYIFENLINAKKEDYRNKVQKDEIWGIEAFSESRITKILLQGLGWYRYARENFPNYFGLWREHDPSGQKN